jgi:putative FmdB family regulatory protein
MPLYEYTCQQCNHSFDELRPMAEADNASSCPVCESKEVNRGLSAIAAPHIGMDSPDVASGASTCACGGACGCGAH